MFANLPLNALRAFESAARLLSFKAAAAELSVTPTAISHQIRALESWLGLVLFERLPRQVRLTDGGQRLFHSLHGALLEVAQSVDTLRPQRSTTHLTLSTTAAFAALWLVPRLGRFYARHPNINVRLDTHCEVIDLHQDASVDLVVRYSLDAYPNLYGMCLFDESFGVYGSPEQVALAARQPPTLISVRWHNSKLYAHGWDAWCAQAGKPGSPVSRASASTTRSTTPCKPRSPGRAWCWRAISSRRKASPAACWWAIARTSRSAAPAIAPCAFRAANAIRRCGRSSSGWGGGATVRLCAEKFSKTFQDRVTHI